MRTVLSLLLIAAFLQTCLNVCSGIIGGREAKPHSRPYMAIVHSGKFCGGILIKDDWILTAAHCILTENKTTVTLGAHYGDQGSHLQIIDVKRSITHEHFNWTNYHNDIQLLQLANKAKLGKYVNYTVLPKTYEDVADGTVCETAGWGKTEHSRPADKLMEVNVTILDRKQCSRKWKKYQITNEMLCTIVGPERKDVRKVNLIIYIHIMTQLSAKDIQYPRNINTMCNISLQPSIQYTQNMYHNIIIKNALQI
ncbi:mast cell protease 1A-like isoform X1 [Rana temporaria]|uniref:mast cell protease 1A-like isoform X1 n=1 Tax=Rana temporaria TaxID=8407 RepID=UPI001AACB8D0|nr:mast cell protease 1A-like isoform X1 [Rana temporaria]